MNPFDEELNQRLATLRGQGLYRELRRVDSAQGPRITIGGKNFLNFSSNDYLGLANHPELKEIAIKAVEKFGVGAGASRLICGSLALFHELEETLAAFKGTAAALTFSTGYAAAIGTICALLGKDDIIIIDKLVHASIVDAAKLSGAKLRIFDHCDLNDLEDILKWANKNKSQIVNSKSQILIVTETIFSMDGNAAPLREIVALKEKYDAWLMVDEAHATGLYGNNGCGLAEELGVSGQIEIQMGTLGKALGASGGYICGSRSLIDFLVNRARSFIFSTAPVPAAAAAAAAGIKLVQSREGQERKSKAWELANLLEHAASSVGVRITAPDSLIMPIIIGDEAKAIEAANSLRNCGIFVPAIRFPTVARGAARLRITLTAAHSDNDIGELVSALSQIVNRKS
jgi:8-amino-7-oxononanoate synthase